MPDEANSIDKKTPKTQKTIRRKSKTEMSLEYLADISTTVGSRQILIEDPETGEVETYNQTVKRIYGQKHFWKLYIKVFAKILENFKSKELDVFRYILENIHPSENKFEGSYEDIAKKTACSRQTVASVMKMLQEKNFIVKIRNAEWMINPEVMFKGTDYKLNMLSTNFKNLQKIQLNKKNHTVPEPDYNDEIFKVTSEEKELLNIYLQRIRRNE